MIQDLKFNVFQNIYEFWSTTLFKFIMSNYIQFKLFLIHFYLDIYHIHLDYSYLIYH